MKIKRILFPFHFWSMKRNRNIRKYGIEIVKGAEEKRVSIKSFLDIQSKRDEKLNQIKSSKSTVVFTKREIESLSKILYLWKTLAPDSTIDGGVEASIFRKVNSLCPDLLLQLRKDVHLAEKKVEPLAKVMVDAFA